MADLLLLLADQSWKEWAITTIAAYSYVGVFSLLVICGLGFPCPEEVALIGGGYAVYQSGGGLEEVALMCTVAMAGVLLGDTVLYFIGRKAGDRAHKLPILGRHLSPARMVKARAMFSKHGAKAVFFGRFLFGVRAVTFLVAGSMRVPLPVFLLMDGIAGLISVPTSIFAAWYFGAHLETALAKVTSLNQVIMIVVAAAAIGVGVWIWRRARSRTEAAAQALEEAGQKKESAQAGEPLVGSPAPPLSD